MTVLTIALVTHNMLVYSSLGTIVPDIHLIICTVLFRKIMKKSTILESRIAYVV